MFRASALMRVTVEIMAGAPKLCEFNTSVSSVLVTGRHLQIRVSACVVVKVRKYS